MTSAASDLPAIEDIIVPALLGLLLVAATPAVHGATWTPRVALLLVLLAIGLPKLLSLMSRRDGPALIAGVAVVAALVSAIVSPQPLLSLLGLYNLGTGALFVASLAAVWALGRTLGETGKRRAAVAIIAGTAVNACVAVIQVTFDVGFFPFQPYERSRASGLLGNPVQLGPLAAGVASLMALRMSRPSPVPLIAIGLLASAVQASGSRTALVLLGVVGIGVLTFRRSFVLVGWVALAITVGIVVIAAVDAPTSPGSASRLGSGAAAGGATARLETWKAGALAVSERPLLGHGPGRFRAATLPHRSLAAVRAEGPDRYFADAHNLVVEYITTTGIIGAAAFLVWIAMSMHRASAPWLVLAVVLAAAHLLQPQMVATTPLLFFALGAGSRKRDRELSRGWIAPLALTIAAATAGVVLLLGDAALEQARLDLQLDDAATAERLLPSAWPAGAAAVAQSYAYRHRLTRDQDLAEQAIHWRWQAATRDPMDPFVWNALGDAQFAVGQFAQAEISYRRTLRLDPFSVRALNSLAYVAVEKRDAALARQWIRRSLEVKPSQKDLLNLRSQLP